MLGRLAASLEAVPCAASCSVRAGKSMTVIEPVDYLNLFVLYVVLTLIRGTFIFASRPIMKWLSAERPRRAPVRGATAVLVRGHIARAGGMGHGMLSDPRTTLVSQSRVAPVPHSQPFPSLESCRGILAGRGLGPWRRQRTGRLRRRWEQAWVNLALETWWWGTETLPKIIVAGISAMVGCRCEDPDEDPL